MKVLLTAAILAVLIAMSAEAQPYGYGWGPYHGGYYHPPPVRHFYYERYYYQQPTYYHQWRREYHWWRCEGDGCQ